MGPPKREADPRARRRGGSGLTFWYILGYFAYWGLVESLLGELKKSGRISDGTYGLLQILALGLGIFLAWKIYLYLTAPFSV